MNKINPKTNSRKAEDLVELFYQLNYNEEDYFNLTNGEMGVVNLARNDTVDCAIAASKSDYVKDQLNRETGVIHSGQIKLNKHQKYIRLFTFCSANFFDRSNPQKGVREGNAYDAFIKKIKRKSPDEKLIVIMSDLHGTEWGMSYLNKAPIVDNSILYFGLNDRCDEVMTYISRALYYGAEVYLMRGAQEHKIKKEFNRDVMKEEFDIINDRKRLHYISEGVSVAVNVVKTEEDGSKKRGTIGFQTNMINKSKTASADLRAAIENNGPLCADVNFVLNGNYVGKLATNQYHVSGQSMYTRTTKGKKPGISVKEYDEFCIYPEGDHKFTVVEGDGSFTNRNTALERKVYTENRKAQWLAKIAKQKIDSEINELFAKSHSNN